MTAARSRRTTLGVPAIVVEGVTVHYGETVALDRADLRLDPGRVCGVIGMNGSGKSTLFKVIMGAVRPDAGSVTLSGLTPTQARQQGLIGYVPQHEEIDWRFPVTVGDVVMMGRYGRMGPMRRPRPADRTAVAEALARVELTDLAGRQIGQLSGGQRKRVFLARGLASEASILLLDEPFAGVDKRSEAVITTVLRESAAAGTTVLISTHDLHGLPELADEAVLIKQTVLLHGSPAEVLTPANLVRTFGLDLSGATADRGAA